MPEAVKKNVRRVRRSQAEWEQIIERFDAGNEPPIDFCRAEGIGICSFYRWRGRLSSAVASQPGLSNGAVSSSTHPTEETVLPMAHFIELDDLSTPPVAGPPQPASGWRVELDLGNGVILRLHRC